MLLMPSVSGQPLLSTSQFSKCAMKGRIMRHWKSKATWRKPNETHKQNYSVNMQIVHDYCYFWCLYSTTLPSKKHLHHMKIDEVGGAAHDFESEGIKWTLIHLQWHPLNIQSIFLLQGMDFGAKCTKTTDLSIMLFSWHPGKHLNYIYVQISLTIILYRTVGIKHKSTMDLPSSTFGLRFLNYTSIKVSAAVALHHAGMAVFYTVQELSTLGYFFFTVKLDAWILLKTIRIVFLPILV